MELNQRMEDHSPYLSEHLIEEAGKKRGKRGREGEKRKGKGGREEKGRREEER